MQLGRGSRLVVASLCALACAASGSSARAQGETASARADRLFREGRAALEAGRYDEACSKLADSQKLDPGTGTLLALALCHEGHGDTATAWREFTEVLEASQKRADRATLAQKHLRALEPRLSKLTVSLADASARGTIRVLVDGGEFPQSRLDTPVPFDPGDHAVEASIPGVPPWKSSVHLGKDGDAKAVLVPKLEAAPAAPVATAPPAPEPAPARGGNRHVVGWIVGGAGAVALGVGGFVGVLALGDHHEATTLCPTSSCTSAQGVSDNDRAKTEAWVADFGIGLGLVGVAAATYLLLTPGSASPAAGTTGVRLEPSVGVGGGGLSLRGSF
jgi:hypothetical protein